MRGGADPAGQVQATTSPKPGMVVSRPVSRCQRAAPTAKTIWTYTETVQWFTAAHLPGLPGQASRASRGAGGQPGLFSSMSAKMVRRCCCVVLTQFRYAWRLTSGSAAFWVEAC